MPATLTRRTFCTAMMAPAVCPPGTLIDTHIHLFDPALFRYHRNATYRPPAATLAAYAKFVPQARLTHAIIVHPEPYQDDHRYLEYCFAHEPSPGFFKGTCLFDPIAPDTPDRMAALVARNPNRIVALRIHENRTRGAIPTTTGPIRDRDLRHPNVRSVWRKAGELGLAIQMHFIPWHAPEIGRLAAEFPATPVVLDHLARAHEGTPADFDEVLKLAKLPRVYLKYSGPYGNDRPLVRRTYDAFGPDRILWGGFGMNLAAFRRNSAQFDKVFAFAGEAARAKIRGCNAAVLYHFD